MKYIRLNAGDMVHVRSYLVRGGRTVVRFGVQTRCRRFYTGLMREPQTQRNQQPTVSPDNYCTTAQPISHPFSDSHWPSRHTSTTRHRSNSTKYVLSGTTHRTPLAKHKRRIFRLGDMFRARRKARNVSFRCAPNVFGGPIHEEFAELFGGAGEGVNVHWVEVGGNLAGWFSMVRSGGRGD